MTRRGPRGPYNTGPAEVRFVARLHEPLTTSDCWIWTGRPNSKGYGTFNPGGGAKAYAHRWAYERLVAPIPAGLQLDHLCRVPMCVNPGHLEPVTAAENMRRMAATHLACPRGHPYDDANTYFRRATEFGRTGRMCRACQRDRYLARKSKRT